MRSIKFTILGVILGVVTGCATIVSKSDYPVSIQSAPENVAFTVVDANGSEIHTGTTPETVLLHAGAGFFQTASYTIQFRDGDTIVKEVELNAQLDGWYLGNVIFGGLIGMLIIDPASGAMFSLPESVTGELENVQMAEKEGSLKVMTIDEVPLQHLSKLQPIHG